jgi:predicted enzyme related to lactoylglutathione lyase
MSETASSFGWYELMTTDMEGSAAFYKSVVGWAVNPVGSPEMPYSTFNVDVDGTSIGVAGLMTLPKEAGQMPAWIGYIHIPDVDAKAKEVVAEGGQLHKGPIDVPGMLRFAVVVDAQGAPFVLFTSDPRMPANPLKPAIGAVGTFGWRELMAVDGPSAMDWYSKLFGWTRGREHDMGPMGIYQLFDIDGVESGGLMTKPPQVPAPFWTFYIQVASVTAAIELIRASGGMVMNGPMEVPGGSWVLQGQDPQGAFFALLSAAQ